VKSELFERRLRLNVAAFHTDYTNIQSSLVLAPPVTPTTTTVVTNFGKAKVDGLELEATARVTEGLTLLASAGYTRFKYNNPLIHQVYTPKWKEAVSAIYNTPTDLGDLNLRVDYTNTDPFFAAQAVGGFNKLSGYSLLNARAALTLPSDLEIAVWGKNLTKEKFFTSAVASADLLSAIPGAPRTYGVELTYRF